MINLNEGFTPEEELPTFKPGQVVYHLNYGYRGLVVDSDPSCTAPDAWYQSNQTQPDRHQPWYHVLVDGSHETTYVAQSNLKLDQSGAPVVHPMLNLFFSGIDEEENKYLRNDVPWDPGQPPDAPPPLPPEGSPSSPPPDSPDVN